MRIKNKRDKLKFNLTVMDYLSKGMKAADVAKKLGMSKDRFSYHIKPLKVAGVIKQIGYGTWIVDPTRYKQVEDTPAQGHTHLSISSTSIRGHGFIFKLRIPKLSNWHNRRAYLSKKDIKFKPIGQNWQGESIVIYKFKVWLTHKSVVVYFPDYKYYMTSTARKAKQLAVYDFLRVIKRLEHLLNVDLSNKGGYKFKVSRQHYALIKNELARQYNQTKQKLFVIDNGNCWLTIDNSFNLDELELIDTVKAQIDTDDVISPFFNSLRVNPVTVDDLTAAIADVTSLQKEEAKKWAYYAANIESHTKAIIKLADLIDKLNNSYGVNNP